MSIENEQLYRFIIDLLRSALNDEKIENVPNDTDWNEVLKVCKSHMIEDMLYETVEKIDSVPEDVLYKWQKYKFNALVTEKTYDIQRSEIVNAFEKNGFKYMLLKGSVLKNYYPHPAMRQMADNDILVELGKLEEITSLLNSLGYESEPFDSRLHDISFQKSPIAHFEIHYHLVDRDNDRFDYFEKTFDRAEKCENSNFGYKLKNEDFYIAMVDHFNRHYARGGCGVRFLTDDYVFLRKFKNSMDWDYVNNELVSLELKDFQSVTEELAESLFSGKDLTDRQLFIFSSIMESGTFGGGEAGTKANAMTFYNGSKFKYLLRKLFPKKSFMKTVYPVLNEKPYLLLFYYFKRMFGKYKNRKVSLKEYLQKILKIKS
ncbi:MAG: hypothetical protein DBY14_04110 [Escherichia coli]|nr:MAG: hypothetical protein DBY14_04110 [Escherichia coli]